MGLLLWTATVDRGCANHHCGTVSSFSPPAQHHPFSSRGFEIRRAKHHRNGREKMTNEVGGNAKTVNVDQRWFRDGVSSRSSLAMAAETKRDTIEDILSSGIRNNTEVSTKSDRPTKNTAVRASAKPMSMPTIKGSWQVWKTIARLEEILWEHGAGSHSPMGNDGSVSLATSEFPLYPASPELVTRVLSILRNLATRHEGKDEWKGLLNKSTLLHEVEESILALHFLQRQLSTHRPHPNENRPRRIVLVDVCCGKGVFSLLSSYVFASGVHNNEDDDDGVSSFFIQKIIMLDKDPKLRWDHIEASNRDNTCRAEDPVSQQPPRPVIECWPRFNLHEMDDVLDRLSGELVRGNDDENPAFLALVGIHLCKTLSPACIGIANGLGPEQCPHLVLAPCCLPRVVVQAKHHKKSSSPRVLEIRQHETPHQRRERLTAKQRRDAAMVRGRGGNKTGATTTTMRQQVDLSGNATAIAMGACWKCGEFGHVKANCPTNQLTGKPQLVRPPTVALDVSGILEAVRPFGTYCDLLATSIQRSVVAIEETGLTNQHAIPETKKQHQSGNQQQHVNNWNRERKSVYIVASDAAAVNSNPGYPEGERTFENDKNERISSTLESLGR
jgi:hypothetical protein